MKKYFVASIAFAMALSFIIAVTYIVEMIFIMLFMIASAVLIWNNISLYPIILMVYTVLLLIGMIIFDQKFAKKEIFQHYGPSLLAVVISGIVMISSLGMLNIIANDSNLVDGDVSIIWYIGVVLCALSIIKLITYGILLFPAPRKAIWKGIEKLENQTG